MATPYGDVTIKKAPQRVVALQTNIAGEMLAVDVDPIAFSVSSSGLTGSPWLLGKADDKMNQKLVSTEGVNFEELADLNPDFILAPTYQVKDQQAFDKFQAIATTVVPNSEMNNFDWQTRLKTTAEALNKQSEADGHH